MPSKMTPINDPKWPERMIWNKTVITIYCYNIQGSGTIPGSNEINLRPIEDHMKGQIKGVASYSDSLIWSDQFWIEWRGELWCLINFDSILNLIKCLYGRHWWYKNKIRVIDVVSMNEMNDWNQVWSKSGHPGDFNLLYSNLKCNNA